MLIQYTDMQHIPDQNDNCLLPQLIWLRQTLYLNVAPTVTQKQHFTSGLSRWTPPPKKNSFATLTEYWVNDVIRRKPSFSVPQHLDVMGKG